MMDMLDIICGTCGASPVEGAARNIGEWNDAGHTDSAHRPNWSITSFKGSEWDAHPNNALWYAEVVYDYNPPRETDYAYGYADSADYPDPLLLVPQGREPLDWIVKRNQAHPEHTGTNDDVMEVWTR